MRERGWLLWVLCMALLWCGAGQLALAAEFAGIGVQVVPTARGELVVLRVLDSSPARAATLLPGDLIIEVDGFALAGSDFAEVVPKRLWGAPGSSVNLTYKRPGEAGVQSVTLRRVPLQPAAAQTPAVRMLTPQLQEGKK